MKNFKDFARKRLSQEDLGKTLAQALEDSSLEQLVNDAIDFEGFLENYSRWNSMPPSSTSEQYNLPTAQPPNRQRFTPIMRRRPQYSVRLSTPHSVRLSTPHRNATMEQECQLCGKYGHTAKECFSFLQ